MAERLSQQANFLWVVVLIRKSRLQGAPRSTLLPYYYTTAAVYYTTLHYTTTSYNTSHLAYNKSITMKNVNNNVYIIYYNAFIN